MELKVMVRDNMTKVKAGKIVSTKLVGYIGKEIILKVKE
jgi:hypothetical protein